MAKKPQVICPHCQERFYREEHEHVQVKNRYYHKECYDRKLEEDLEKAREEQRKQEQKERERQEKIARQTEEERKKEEKRIIVEKIHSKLQYLYGVNYSRLRIQKQIKQFLSEGKTEIGILQALEYWYDVKGNDPEKARGGIGIISYIYGDAMDYWYQQKQNATLNAGVIIPDVTESVVISPTPIQKPKRFKLFDIR